MTLPEIPVADGTAAIEPSLDYIVAKFPRFPFDKFQSVPNVLGTQMKATGEVMGIGATLEECFLKSVRSLETGVCHFRLAKFDDVPAEELLTYLAEFHDDNIYAIAELLRRGESVERIHAVTAITELFLESLQRITRMEQRLAAAPQDADVLREAKIMGFSDRCVAELWNVAELDVYNLRKSRGITPVFRMVDTLHTEHLHRLSSTLPMTRHERVPPDRQAQDRRPRRGPHPHRTGRGVRLLHRPRRPDHQAAPAMRRSSSTTTPRRSPPTTPPPTSSISSR